MADNKHRYCVIMCGGIGSRFWPYSRTNMPKQFLDFLGTGRSLLQMTYDRIRQLVPDENIILLTNEQYASTVREQLPEVPVKNVLLEPARRNTAPCNAWAARHIAARDPEASIVVTPSDHLITREAEFTASLTRAFEFVETHDALLTLGVKPTRPETGYGYIQIDTRDTGDIRRVKTFTEKPDAELAKVFLQTGEFFWNSGIFLWKAATIINAFEQLMPDMAGIFSHGADTYGTPDEMRFINENFPACVSISIDYAIMEKARNVYVEMANFGWSDLGTWGSLYDMSPKNSERNVTQNCRVLAYDSTGNIIAEHCADKIVVVDGLSDFIVADTPDVLLICPKSNEQQIRRMVTDAKMNFGEKYI